LSWDALEGGGKDSMTTAELYAIPVQQNGWRVLPTGNYVTLGNCVKLGDGVKLGNYVKLATGVKLGDGVTLGDCVKLGDGVTLGNYVTLGTCVKLGDGVKLGNYVTLGDDVTLGNGVTLGNDVTLGNSPMAVQGSRHLAVHVGDHLIQIGCMTLTFAQWVETFQDVGIKHGYTALQIVEYKRILDFIIGSTPDGLPL
jgi:hypothetical protein